MNLKRKVELGKADGYFWNMYFNLLRSNRLMFAGINKAFITGDMAHMLNGIYQENRFNCIYEIERIAEEHKQLISLKLCLLIPVMITSCWKESCRLRQGLLVPVIQLRIIIWFMTMTYHDDEVGKKAQAELSTFMEKKRTQFDFKN